MLSTRIPVTIITGFLGSGKTTLINSILRNNPNVKFAIVENEFGEISIDSDLIEYISDGIVELSNGCICCSLNSELEEIFFKLLNSDRDIEHILIETTGIANPNSVCANIIIEPTNEYLFFNGTICLIDVNYFLKNFETYDIIQIQTAFADHVIVNKIMSNSIIHLDETIEKVRNTNLDCKISLNHDIDFSKILNDLPDYRGSIKIIENQSSAHNFKSSVLEFDFEFEREHFEYAINSILRDYGDKILRIKGLICFEGANNIYVFQSVQYYGDLQLLDKELVKKNKKSSLVFIYKDINIEVVERLLNTALVDY